MKSLQPLRDAVPCELVMADTGSTDGSREIAERYADVLFDFPWINDFAAARNAVLDRSTGDWYLVLDADEWLDENIDELVLFLLTPQINEPYPAGAFIVRNYSQKDLGGDYSDFLAVRMVRRSTGNRYVGAIHEHWKIHMDNLHGFGKSILHHDGYVNFGGGDGKSKRERNQQLLQERLKEDPDNMLLLLQCMESGTTGAEQEHYIRHALEGVHNKRPTWDQVGPPIYRYAVMLAKNRGLMELQQWVHEARELFPDNLFTRVDIAYAMCLHHMEKKEYQEAISYGETYLQATLNYRTKLDRIEDLVYSSLMSGSPSYEKRIRIYLADAYFYEKEFQKSKDMLLSVDTTQMSVSDTKNYVGIMMNLHAQGGLDMSAVAAAFWDRISNEPFDQKDVDKRKGAYVSTAAIAFPKSYRELEDKNGYRHAYTLFLPLEGKCGVGDAAALLNSRSVARMTEILAAQRDLGMIPIAAIVHAMQCGVHFPLPGKPMDLEEMDTLASRLATNKDDLFSLALKAVDQLDADDVRHLLWVRGLILSAMGAFSWNDKKADEEQGMDIARAFVKVEEIFLPMCYNAEVLQEDKLFMLPPMHRFGWYCVRIIRNLDQGNFAASVRDLHASLSQSGNTAQMVDFLLKRVAEQERNARIMEAPPELIALANQVKVMLARFDPGDPAVEQLKSSPAYQQVAWLIEEPTQPAFGAPVQ